jgi:penicillin-binding protein 1A
VRRDVVYSVVLVPALLLVYVLLLIPFTPSTSDLAKAKIATPSLVMSVDGQELAAFQRVNRGWVKLADISPNAINALIATEDRRFYEHHGLDFKRTASAALQTLTGDRQGGSTITQQLARNLYPEEIGRSMSITRKIKEAITAFKIEAVYSKDEILETYLNTVPFLYNAFGIEMAARTYFDKSASTLNLLESATLVGMLKGTSYYNPVLNPERALSRRNIVLAQMVKSGTLKALEFEKLKKIPLKIEFERQSDATGPAAHVAQQLKRWLIDWADRNDYNIYADGLVLRTSIDSRLQAMANRAVTQQGDKLQKNADAEWSPSWRAKAGNGERRSLVLDYVRASSEYKAERAAGASAEQALASLIANPAFMQQLQKDKTRLQAGFMALDPRNGHVMAWVGSRNYGDDQFDHVQQAKRQPGSTFKPFVYAAAFENGALPSDRLMDLGLEITLSDGSFWRPSDGGGPSGLPMSLRQGLMYSKNVITAQVMQSVGPAHVAKLARDMGVRQSKLDEVPSLALGTSPVTLKEMVSAYGTLANEGKYIEPLLVLQVLDRKGRVLESFEPKPPEQALPITVAQTLLDVMRGVINQGTGTAIRSFFGIEADVAGKTGTTQSNTDGWFILMQPQLVAGAWVGFNDNRVTMSAGWGQGARSALPIVGDFFRQAIREKLIDPAVRFSAPQLDSSGDPSLGESGLSEQERSPAIANSALTAETNLYPSNGTIAPGPGVRYLTLPRPVFIPNPLSDPLGYLRQLFNLSPEALPPQLSPAQPQPQPQPQTPGQNYSH